MTRLNFTYLLLQKAMIYHRTHLAVSNRGPGKGLDVITLASLFHLARAGKYVDRRSFEKAFFHHDEINAPIKCARAIDNLIRFGYAREAGKSYTLTEDGKAFVNELLR